MTGPQAGANERLTVARDEFRSRCDRALVAVQRMGASALLVWGRGGGPVDGAGSLLYLTDHYPSFPAIPDHPGHWQGHGFGAALLTPDGQVILMSDVAYVQLEDVFATSLVSGQGVVDGVAKVLDGLGLAGGRIALAGSGAMTRQQSLALRQRCPQLELIDADQALDRLRAIKSPAEIEKLRAAADVGTAAMEAMLEAAEPGASEAGIVAAGVATITRGGGVFYNCFAGSSGGTEGERSWRRRMPGYLSRRIVRPGEVWTADISGALDGYYFDLSRSRVIGSGADTRGRIGDIAAESVHAVLGRIRPGVGVADAVAAGVAVVERANLGEVEHGFEAFGHGIGLGWDAPWLTEDSDEIFEAGMCIAVEKHLIVGADEGGHEDDVVVTSGGIEFLTRCSLAR